MKWATANFLSWFLYAIMAMLILRAPGGVAGELGAILAGNGVGGLIRCEDWA